MIKSSTYQIFLCFISLTHFAFANMAEVPQPSNPREQAPELCDEGQRQGNLIASRIFGSWKVEKNITSSLGNIKGGLGENADMELSFQADDQVLSSFEPLGDSYSCVYAQGQYSWQVTVDGNVYQKLSGPFMVLSKNGNTLLVTKHEDEPMPKQYLSIGFAGNAANDILFVGRESGCEYGDDELPSPGSSIVPKYGCNGRGLVDITWAFVRNN